MIYIYKPYTAVYYQQIPVLSNRLQSNVQTLMMRTLRSSGHSYNTCDPVNIVHEQQTNICSTTRKGQREGIFLHCLDEAIVKKFQATKCYSFQK